MLINLFAKIFLAPSCTKIDNKNDQFFPIKIHKSDITNNPYEFFDNLLSDYKNKEFSKHSFNILIPDYDGDVCNKLLAGYLWYLNIKDIEHIKEFLSLYAKYYKEFEEEWSHIITVKECNELNCALNGGMMDLLDYIYVYDHNQSMRSGIHIDHIKYIPLEYLINCIYDKDIGKFVVDKIEAFRAYDLLNAITKLFYKKFLEGESTLSLSNKITTLYSLNLDRTFKDIAVTDNGKSIIRGIFEEYGEQEVIDNILDADIISYLKYAIDNTDMGYSDLGMFKFNKLIAKYVIDSGFKPEIYKEE